MQLKEYLSDNNLTQTSFIEEVYRQTKVRIPQGTLAKWITGVRIPRRQEILIIYNVTGNKVQPNDFYGVTDEN